MFSPRLITISMNEIYMNKEIENNKDKVNINCLVSPLQKRLSGNEKYALET